MWVRRIQDDYGRFGLNHGYASSPLLFEDRLIVPVIHGMTTDEPSYVFAVNKLTGETLWHYQPEEVVSTRAKTISIYQDLILFSAPAPNGEPQPIIALDNFRTGPTLMKVPDASSEGVVLEVDFRHSSGLSGLLPRLDVAPYLRNMFVGVDDIQFQPALQSHLAVLGMHDEIAGPDRILNGLKQREETIRE